MLTLREKFIAHWLFTTLIGMIDKQPEEAVEAVIEGIRTTRLRNLKDSEVEEIVRELNDEFLVSGNTLNTLQKIKKSRVKRNDWRKDLR